MLFIAGAALSWGSVGVTVQGINRVATTTALVIGFLRLVIAGPTLALVHTRTTHAHPLRFARRDVPVVGIMGFAMAAYQVTEFAAIPRLGVTRTILLAICVAPIFIALFAALALRERPAARALPPMALTLVGTALLVGSGGTEATPISALGVALALGAAASYAAVAVASRAVAGRYPPAQTTAVAFTFGALLLLPLAVSSGRAAFALGGRGWLLVALLGLVPTALGYLLFLRGLRTVPAATAGVIGLLEPLAATILAALLFGERLAPLGIGGALLLLIGLALLVAKI